MTKSSPTKAPPAGQSLASSSLANSPLANNGTGLHNLELMLLLGLLAAIGPLTVDTYLPSMPAISADFGVSSSLVQLSVSSYFFGLAIGQIICGALSDRFGRRPILFAGLVLYVIASVACSMAPSATALVVARLIQGLGASASAAAGRAVIRDVWAGNQAAKAMSFVMMLMAFAPIIAPIMGGYIFTHFGWRPIFWVMTGFGVLLVALVLFRLPETNTPEKRAGVRLVSTFRAYGFVLSSARAWALLLCGGLSYAVMFAYITGSPGVYISTFGIDPAYFGYFFAINVVALTLGNWCNTRLVTHYGYRAMLGGATLVSLLGVIGLLLCSLANVGGLTAVVIMLFIAVGPVSMTGGNAIAGLMNLYPRNAGAASALFGVGQFGFGGFAGVLVGLLFGGATVQMAAAMLVMSGGAFIAWLVLYFMGKPAGMAAT